MYKKGQVDWKGLTIFNNQISFFCPRGLYIFNFIAKVSLPLYLGSSFLHCGRVSVCIPCTYNNLWFGRKRLTIDGTVMHFNFSMDVTSPVCAGPDLLHG